MSIFLEEDDIARLTGCKQKGNQIDTLRKMGVAFYVNVTGHPVVTTAAIEGRSQTEKQKTKWVPRVLKTG